MKSLKSICKKCPNLTKGWENIIDIDNSVYSKDIIVCGIAYEKVYNLGQLDYEPHSSKFPFKSTPIPNNCPYQLEYLMLKEKKKPE